MQVLLPTSYFPPVSYVASCLKVDKINIELHETYPKQTLRNHCTIYGPNGKHKLSIPVIRINGNHTMVRDIRIANESDWQKIQWRSIETAYNNSPFFLYYRDHFEGFFRMNHDLLFKLNTEILIVILDILGFKKEIVFTERFDKEPGITDMRRFPSKNSNEISALFPRYEQTFSQKHGFLPDLSILDILFNLGPETGDYLETISSLYLPQ